MLTDFERSQLPTNPAFSVPMARDQNNVPLIPDDILDYLSKMFPPVEVTETSSLDQIRFRGGQRSVVTHLLHIQSCQKTYG